RGIDGRDPARPVGVVERVLDGLGAYLKRGSAIAVDAEVGLRGADLQVGGDVLQSGKLEDFAFQLLSYGVELLLIRGVEGKLVGALGHLAPELDGRGILEEHAHAGYPGEVLTEILDDVVDEDLAMRPGLQVNDELAEIGAAESGRGRAANRGNQGVHVGVPPDDVGNLLLVLDHFEVGGALGGLRHGDDLVRVLVRNEAFGYHYENPGRGGERHDEDADRSGTVAQHPLQAGSVNAQHPFEEALGHPIENPVFLVRERPQEPAAQHRREGHRNDARDQDGHADGDGEFLEEPAQNAAHE